MYKTYLGLDALRRAVNLRDLSNPSDGEHAVQLIATSILEQLQAAWNCELLVYRASPIVSVEQNYDALNYPRDGAAREARYTRYVCDTALLRTHTSAMIPEAISSLRAKWPDRILLACPGLAYRRDCIDRLHSAEPHQMDLWYLTRRETVTGFVPVLVAPEPTALQAPELPADPPNAGPAPEPAVTSPIEVELPTGVKLRVPSDAGETALRRIFAALS